MLVVLPPRLDIALDFQPHASIHWLLIALVWIVELLRPVSPFSGPFSRNLASCQEPSSEKKLEVCFSSSLESSRGVVLRSKRRWLDLNGLPCQRRTQTTSAAYRPGRALSS